MDPHLVTALASGHGALARRDHPGLRGPIDTALRRGRLVALFPGVYARASEARRLAVRARAACLADPDAVVTGAAAAILAGRDNLPYPERIAVASHSLRRARPGFTFERRRIDASLVRTVDGVRLTTRALTALDLAVERGDAELDDALRRGAEPAELKRALALSAGRRGFGSLRKPVEDLRDRPWSIREREAHCLLRDAGIEGWVANRAVYDLRGETLLGYGDLLFDGVGLVIELDGASYHPDPAADAARDLRFARAGWEVVRLGEGLVRKEPAEFVAVVRDLLRTRERRRRRPNPGPSR